MSKILFVRFLPQIYLTFIVALCFIVFYKTNAHSQNLPPLLDPVTLITGEWSPYVTEFDPHHGHVSKLVTQTLRGMNKKPNYVFFPFFAGYEKAKTAEAYATFPYFHTKERATDFYYSDPLAQINYVVFIRSDDASKFSAIKSVKDLKNFSTAKVAGYAYGALDPYIKSVGEDVPSEIQAFQMLLQNKVDYIAASDVVGQKLIERYFFKEQHRFQIVKVNEASPPKAEKTGSTHLSWPIDIHVLFPKSRLSARADRDAFNQSLKKVLATGYRQVLQELYTKDVKSKYVVRLSDPASFALVTAKEDKSDTETLVIPRGSKALVVEWSKNFYSKENSTVHKQMNAYTQVKLLNGPLQGRVVWVQNMFIELPEE
ncbi:MAG: hypothetical protein AAF228_11350 [Pseudomonadota bacterium]